MPKSLVHPWTWPDKAMDRVHIDFLEYNDKSILLLVDAYSKWAEAKLMTKTDSASTIDCLKHWFAAYGLPKQVVSDNGGQFTSAMFKSFIKSCGIKHMYVAPYHQSSNGQVERYVQIIKKGLRRAATNISQNILDEILMFHKSSPSTATGKTPAKLFLGRELRTKIDIMKPSNNIEVTFVPNSEGNTKRRAPTRYLEAGDMVQIRWFIGSKKWMKGRVTRKIGNQVYEVKVNDKLLIRHIDHMIKIKAEDSNEWNDTVTINDDSNTERRYPVRERRPTQRYGFEQNVPK